MKTLREVGLLRFVKTQVLTIYCLVHLIDSLDLTSKNGQTYFEVRSQATFTCTILPYTGTLNWYYGATHVAGCTGFSCTDIDNDQGAFQFQYDTTSFVFTWNIPSVQIKYDEKTFTCNDGTNNQSKIITVDVKENDEKNQKLRWLWFLILIIPISVGLMITCFRCKGCLFYHCNCCTENTQSCGELNCTSLTCNCSKCSCEVASDSAVPTVGSYNTTKSEENKNRPREGQWNESIGMLNSGTSKQSKTALITVPVHAINTKNAVTIIWDSDIDSIADKAMFFWKPYIKEHSTIYEGFKTELMQQNITLPQNLPELIRIYELPDWIGTQGGSCEKPTFHLRKMFRIERTSMSSLMVFVYWTNKNQDIIAKSEEKILLHSVPIDAKLTQETVIVSWQWASLLNAVSTTVTVFHKPYIEVITDCSQKKKKYKSAAMKQNTLVHQNVPDTIHRYDLPDWIDDAWFKEHKTSQPECEVRRGSGSSLMIFAYWTKEDQIIGKSDEIARFQRAPVNCELTMGTLTVNWKSQPDVNDGSAIVFYKPIIDHNKKIDKQTRKIDHLRLPSIYRNDQMLSVHTGELDYEHDFVHRFGFPDWLDESTSSCEILHPKNSHAVHLNLKSNFMVFVCWKNNAGVLLAISDEKLIEPSDD